MRMGERVKSPATTDFRGRPIENLIPKRLPETDGILCKSGVPSPGDRVRTHDGREGTVLETGELAHFGDVYRSIRTEFDSGEKWFIAMLDIQDHWTP